MKELRLKLLKLGSENKWRCMNSTSHGKVNYKDMSSYTVPNQDCDFWTSSTSGSRQQVVFKGRSFTP